MKPFLLLDHWRLSPVKAAWVKTKIFLKEGLFFGNWHDVWKDRSIGGSVSIPRELAEGLAEMNIPFRHNEYNLTEPIETAVVLKDPRCLKWALKEKRRGRIKRVYAGPFITTLPSEAGEIMLDKKIDGLIFFSEWHKRLFTRLARHELPLGHLWFAGVDPKDWKDSKAEKSRALVYDKSRDPEFLERVVTELRRRGEDPEVLTYGAYTPGQFRDALSRARFAVFLSRSETQGLAMFEAWSSNVPTLHWNPGVMRYLGRDYEGVSSCAYLSPETGRDFHAVEDFPAALDAFLPALSTFRPRERVLNGLTRRHSVERFLTITEEANQ